MADERREPADFFLRFCECLNRFDVRYVVVGSEIGLEDLLANKRAAGRPKDLADVQALEQRGRKL
jgi:hypothetical protein